MARSTITAQLRYPLGGFRTLTFLAQPIRQQPADAQTDEPIWQVTFFRKTSQVHRHVS